MARHGATNLSPPKPNDDELPVPLQSAPSPAAPVRERSVQSVSIQCPICQRPFKTVEQVDLHIDSCTGTLQSRSYSLPPSKPTDPTMSKVSTRSTNLVSVNPLPKVNYAMYNEKQLRTLLSEHGLPTWGSKPLLSARHKEYINIYNANLDRLQPLSQPELLRQMERWDMVQQNVLRGEKRKIDSEEWGKKFNENFAELARRARESVKKKKVEDENGNANGEITGVVRPSQEETIV